MPRQLPWKIGGATTKQAPSRTKPTASPAPSASRSPAPQRPTPTPKAESTPDPRRNLKPRRSLGLGAARSPSTSPPPEPLQEELMIEGIDHDDMYRMVEDEFLAVAGDFTRHLHAAEYQRLKGLAKSENAETIQNISRPVTGEMTDLVKRRHAALDTASKQRKGIAKILGKQAAGNGSSEDREERSRRQPTSLQGLMDSPRKQRVPLNLTAVTRPSSGHRPADGSPSRRRPSSLDFQGVAPSDNIDTRARNAQDVLARPKREPSTDFDDDDLDGPPSWPPRPNPRHPEQAAKPPTRQLAAPKPLARTESEPTNTRNPFQMAGNAPKRSFTHDTPLSEPADAANDDEDEDFFSRLRARRAEQKRRRETKAQDSTIKTSESQAAALNSIPFM